MIHMMFSGQDDNALAA
jgi:hypothetical protein